MAKRTEGLDEVILGCARKEFLDKGYEEASLRTIAGNASVSTSTIYTRYQDKEGLFRALITPAARKILDYMQQSLHEFEQLPAEDQIENRQTSADRGFSGFLDILYEYFDEFRLMTTCSTNELYRYYLEKIVEVDLQCTVNYLKVTDNPAFKEGRLTEGFIHVVSSAFYSGIFEIAVHNMNRQEAEKYSEELIRFYRNGWSTYFQTDLLD